MKLGADNTLPTSTTLDVDVANTNDNAIFDLNGFNQTVGGLQRTNAGGGAGGAIITNSGAADKTLTINQSATTSFNGIIQDGGTNKTIIVKDGAGTLTLSGTNTYTGATTVNGGILNVTGSTALDSAVAVGGASATGTPQLTGSGTINGAVTVKSAGGGVVGSLNAGDATAVNKVGTLSMGSSLSFESGSIFEWDLNANKDTDGLDNDLGATTDNGLAGIDFDKVNVTGNLSIDAAAVFKVIQNTGVTFTDTFWTQNQTWSNILNVTGTTTSGWSNTAVSVFNTSGTLQNVSTYGSFTISGSTLTWNAVPEPTSALVGLLITAGLLRRRRVA